MMETSRLPSGRIIQLTMQGQTAIPWSSMSAVWPRAGMIGMAAQPSHEDRLGHALPLKGRW